MNNIVINIFNKKKESIIFGNLFYKSIKIIIFLSSFYIFLEVKPSLLYITHLIAVL